MLYTNITQMTFLEHSTSKSRIYILFKVVMKHLPPRETNSRSKVSKRRPQGQIQLGFIGSMKENMWQRLYVTHNAYNTYYLTIFRKTFPNSVLGHKTCLNTFKRIHSIQSMLLDPSGIKWKSQQKANWKIHKYLGKKKHAFYVIHLLKKESRNQSEVRKYSN